MRLTKAAYLLPALLMGSALAASEAILHRGGAGDPTTLDSQAAGSTTERAIMADLFTGLLALGPAGQIINGTAESWSVSKDGKKYEFQLREGLHWSDGVALTADDYVYGLRRLMDPKTGNSIASYLYCIAGAEAVHAGDQPLQTLGVRRLDKRRIEVQLAAPAPYFPEMIAMAWDPAPRHVIEKHGKGWSQPGVHVSNGAFKLAEWVPNQYVKLEKNDYFFSADEVLLDAVYHYPGEDLARSMKQFRAGELHIVSAFPAAQLGWVKENMPDALRVTPTIRTETLLFNTSRHPLDDARVRLALSMAIDRERLVEKILKGNEQPAYSVVPPGAINYADGARAAFHALTQAERLDRARGLLADAGYDANRPLRVELRLDASETRKQVAVAIASMWKQLGVQTTLQTSEDKARLSDMVAGNFQIVTSLRLSASADAYTFLPNFQTKAGRLNTTRYRSPRFDMLMMRAAQTADLDQRARWIREAEAQLLADHPIAPLYVYSARMLVSPRVRGWRGNPRGINPSRYLSLDN